MITLYKMNLATYQKKKQTTKERTTEFRKKVEQEWKTTYFEFIKEYIGTPGFNWFNLTNNPNIDPQFIFDNPQYPWHIPTVIERTDIQIETLITKYSVYPGFWTTILRHKDVSMEYIDAHPEYPWAYSHIHLLKTLSIDFIKKHEAQVLFWNLIQFHNGYTFKEFYSAFPDRVDKQELIYRTGMTVKKALATDSDILEVLIKTTCSHPKICELVNANPRLKWDWIEISLNPNLTVPFMHKYQKKICWDILTSVIPKQIIRDNHRFPWDYSRYCYRTDLTRGELFEHLPSYNIFEFGFNPQIRFDDFKRKDIAWDINSVSGNIFEVEKKAFINKKYNEYLSAYRIQQFINLVTTSPEYAICRKRISADYDREFLNDDGCLIEPTKKAK